MMKCSGGARVIKRDNTRGGKGVENELKDSLLKLVNFRPDNSVKIVNFRDNLKIYLLHRQYGDYGGGMTLHAGTQGSVAQGSVAWVTLDCGGSLLGSFDRDRFLLPTREEYIDVGRFFTDIHHPTDDELCLLSVVYPWASPAILLLGECLEYLNRGGSGMQQERLKYSE